ncbi:hypothetical protein T265_12268 [Opisthorchis viverrini]|uniref:Uncharacterized protein n=1 Tax=Opisthorchis viverrini TaxID=6198 RepID=A0A074YUT3_OPIVI|nr:hypothetical protein T265_12268 [Opisthorchis viverrini]KER18463.1 hypothetical protein T265_12268 [Opisthorchis viverrini]
MNRSNLTRGNRVQTMILYVKRGYAGIEATWYRLKTTHSNRGLFSMNFRIKQAENEKRICGKPHSSVTRKLTYHKATKRRQN